MSLLKKEKRAIRFINNIPKENTQLAFSGGKDSIVLYYLLKLSNLDIPIIYGNTTIDPPGTKKLINDYYSDVNILNPKKSYFKLIEQKGLPTRVGRFCCEHLKERYGIGKNNIEGIRSGESNKRKLYEPEQCDTRKWMKGAKHYYPILDFTEREVWHIIKSNNLKTLPYYYMPYNFKRHGCVGCPLTTKHQQIKEFKTFPKYSDAIIKAIAKNMLKMNKIGQNFNDPYEVFWWWISRESIIKWKSNLNTLFELNYKEEYYKIIHNLK